MVNKLQFDLLTISPLLSLLVTLKRTAPSTGHNSRQLDLDKIVAEAVRGLRVVEEGEAKVIEGWLIYGEVLNRGRKMFSSNNHFHDWMPNHNFIAGAPRTAS